MTTLDWLCIATIIFCLLLSFVFAGSETALMAFSRARMLRLEKKGNRSAGIVNRLLEARERLIGALLLGNNAVNIAASSLATSVFLLWFGDVGVIYATIAMTVLVVVFAEVLPKTDRDQRSGPHCPAVGQADAMGHAIAGACSDCD